MKLFNNIFWYFKKFKTSHLWSPIICYNLGF
jgi:hypothetical protein